MYDTRKITHGTNNVAMQGGADGSTGTIIFATGITKFAPSTDQDSKTLNADAQTHMTLQNPKKLTIEISQYQYNSDELKQMGYTVDETTGVTLDNGLYPKFAIQRLLTELDAAGNEVKKLEVYYGATSGDYSESDDEDEDEINPKVYTRTLKIDGIDVNGANVKKMMVIRTSENATTFDKYATKILTPADFASTPNT